MSVTALQDWLNISPATSKTVRLIFFGPLRDLLPSKRDDSRYSTPLLRRGLERC